MLITLYYVLIMLHYICGIPLNYINGITLLIFHYIMAFHYIMCTNYITLLKLHYIMLAELCCINGNIFHY